mgnify:CR=1 FL=1
MCVSVSVFNLVFHVVSFSHSFYGLFFDVDDYKLYDDDDDDDMSIIEKFKFLFEKFLARIVFFVIHDVLDCMKWKIRPLVCVCLVCPF